MDFAFQTPHGGWRVTGSRVSLDSVVYAYHNGQSPEQIVLDFPSLSLEQVYGAIAFYLRNRADIDRYLAEQDVGWEQMRVASAARDEPLLKRLRAMKATQPNPVADS